MLPMRKLAISSPPQPSPKNQHRWGQTVRTVLIEGEDADGRVGLEVIDLVQTPSIRLEFVRATGTISKRGAEVDPCPDRADSCRRDRCPWEVPPA